jgi:hypothetical protein
MKTLLRCAAFVAAPLVLASGAASTTGKAPAPVGRTKEVVHWVQTVAMSGSQVAYSTGEGIPFGPGDKVYVWDVRTGKGRLISGRNPDPVFEVGISSRRVAWITRGGTAPDPTAEINETLYSAALAKPSRPEWLDSAFRTESEPVPDFPGGCTGDWIDGLVGSQNILAVNRWHTTGATSDVTGAELDLITAAGLRKKSSGEGSLIAQSTDGARIAVLQSREAWPAGGLCGQTATPTVRVYTSTGKRLTQLTVAGAKEVALSGNNLVALTKASTIAVYNWRTGRLVHSWRVPQVPYVHLEDVYGQLVVYSVYSHGRNLHLLQFATGKDRLLVKGSGLVPYYTRGNDAQLEGPGLVYAADLPGHGDTSKLVFVPMARVVAAVSKGHVR